MELEVVTGPEVTTGPISQETKTVGSQDFVKSLLLELNKKTVWRSLISLSSALHVNPQELSQWLDKSPNVARRIGKNDTYYCLFDRLSDGSNASSQEEDYAMAMLHMTYYQFYKTMKTYGLEIGRRDTEAFSHLTSALDKMESGLVLFSKKIKAPMEKLPKFS